MPSESGNIDHSRRSQHDMFVDVTDDVRRNRKISVRRRQSCTPGRCVSDRPPPSLPRRGQSWPSK